MTNNTTEQPNATNGSKLEAADQQRLIDYTGQIEAIRRSQAVIEFELDGTILYANENFLNCVGYTLDEIKGQHHKMFAEPEYAASTDYAAFWQRLNAGEFFTGEFKRLGKGGKEIWIQATYNPILDENGKPFKVVKFATDVTEERAVSEQAKRLANAVEGSSTASMQVDRDLIITGVNPATVKLVTESLPAFQKAFPNIDFSGSLVGTCIDVFHKNPEHQRRVLSDPSNLPYQAEIQVEDLVFALNISAIRDGEGQYVGATLEWQNVTKERAAANRAESLFSLIENAATNFMTCDRDLVITYCNPSVLNMLRRYQTELREFFPGFDADNLVGTCIDQFHKNPSHQRTLLADTSKLPAKAELKLGELEFGVNATALFDAEGNHIGNGVEWTDLNERAKYSKQVSKVIAASESGDLSVRGDLEVLDDVYRPMMEGINEIIEAVVRPITEASEVLESVAGSDLTARMEGDYKGDYAKIKDNLNSAAQSLEEAMLAVADSAGQVGAASSQISEGAQKLAEGASTQASSIEEISASLQEMQAMTAQNADNAGQANSLSGDALGSADKGNEAMGRMQTAIDKIKDSSDQTAKIVKTIDEIAFQTNLLALNAAVEAARAGDAGKGFAVVAEEVRSLAKRSAEAAKTTAELIDDAVKNAEGGVTITEDVKTILTDIVDGSRKVNDLIAEIASASKEQAEGIKQITEGVTAMDKVTQENSANSEESAAAATQLNEQAQTLNQMIGQFNLGGSSPAGAASAVAIQPKVKQPETKPAAPAKPQEVIPLDDEELAEF